MDLAVVQVVNVEDLMSGETPGHLLSGILKIIGADLVLSGDNAVVIALAARSLPQRQRFLGILFGTLAAVLFRILFTLAVGSALVVPMLSLIGGLLLLWIAVRLLVTSEAQVAVDAGQTLADAIRIIVVADVVMSLDNMLAIAGAANGDWRLVAFGLVLSIPLVVGGSAVLSSVMGRFPILVWAGAALLGWIAGELIASERMLGEWLGVRADLGLASVRLAFAALGALFVLLSGLLLGRRRSA